MAGPLRLTLAVDLSKIVELDLTNEGQATKRKNKPKQTQVTNVCRSLKAACKCIGSRAATDESHLKCLNNELANAREAAGVVVTNLCGRAMPRECPRQAWD